jgi:hypothetical protein
VSSRERARQLYQKLPKAQAKLKSAQGQYNIQSRQRKEYNEQQDKCLIKAEKPGLGGIWKGRRRNGFLRW